MILYHNPRCSTSRDVLEILQKTKTRFEIREYLHDPPNKAELKSLISKLGCAPFDLVRTKEPFYIENFSDKNLSNTQWLNILVKHPILIQRPIVIDEHQAIIGRPTELVISFIKKAKAGVSKK